MRRRTFVTTTALGGLAATLARPLHAISPAVARNGIGLQLWTVRNQMAEDPKATIKAIAEAGYRQVELMNVLDSQSIVEMAKEHGLEVRSAFFNWESIANPGKQGVPSVEAVIEKAKSFGLEYLVFGYVGRSNRDTAEKLRALCDRANVAAEKIDAAGMKMSYHNHSFEFETLEGDTTGFDIFMERFDPKLVNFELDVFWAAIGGWDPVETMGKLGKRLGQIHLKDLKAEQGTIYDEGKVPADAFQEVGDGVLDMNKIVQVATDLGVTQFHVEQDESPNPIESISQSIGYVKKIW